MAKYKKIGRQTKRFQETEFMTVTITRPPKGFKIWKVLAIDSHPDRNHYSWDCQVLAAIPKHFDPTPRRS